MKRSISLKVAFVAVFAMLAAACGGGEQAAQPAGIPPQQMADALFSVMKGTRTAYTKHIVQRLGKDMKVVEADEHWEDGDKHVMLPAQMFRYSRDLAMEANPGFTYSLQSKWPINKQNAPKTPMEKEGLEYIAKEKGKKNFYGEEKLGDVTYFTAVYADVAVTEACVDCHNMHEDSPRDDFAMDEVMGGVVIRIPMPNKG